jgi:hypothetical protein
LAANGEIQVNDSTVAGTFLKGTSVTVLVGFNLKASPPTATLLVAGGANNASMDVEIPTVLANAGLSSVRIETPVELDPEAPTRFFLNDVEARRVAD